MLAKAVEIAQGQEAAAQNLKKLRSASESMEMVQRVGTSMQARGHGAKPRNSKPAPSKPCYRCGATDHWASMCRFKDATCHKCKKRGHIAKVCRGGGNHSQFQNQSGADKRRPTHTVQETSPRVEEQFSMFRVQEPHSHQAMFVQVEVQGSSYPWNWTQVQLSSSSPPSPSRRCSQWKSYLTPLPY